MTSLEKLFSHPAGLAGLLTRKVADLVLPTGQLVAGEPLPEIQAQPFRQAVGPGCYPVYLHLLPPGNLIAYAELRVSPARPVRWEMAVTSTQDPASLAADEVFGYPVDTGFGCFLDASTVALLKQHDAALQEENEEYNNYYDDFLDDLLYDPEAVSTDYGAFQPCADKENNVVLFRTGYGDGFYTTYVGMDEAGHPVRFVTEFIAPAES